MVDRPEQRAEPHRLGAEQRLDINGLPAKTDPDPAELFTDVYCKDGTTWRN